jgi:3-hydroxyacyl-[acyl-carrier-protein] dehydratase
MSGFEADPGGRLRARFVFDPDFVGFAGHFPDHKVLPGVCQISCVKEVLREWKKLGVRLRELVRAKYLLPVSPGDECMVECWDLKEAGGEYDLKAGLSRGGEKVSEFRLRVAFDGSDAKEGG